MEARGIYRERNGWGTQHCVRVKYDDEHQELDVAEDRYRARGYQPPFDQLPWKDEVEQRGEAINAIASSGRGSSS
jgi:hypothetical protein